MAIGFTVMLLSVSVGIHSGAGGGAGAFGLLLSFTGVLAGANLVTVGVRMADHRVPTVLVVFEFDGARALAALMRRNIAVVGLVMASCAFTAVSGEAGPMFCFAMLALLLLAVSLINIGARGE
ncbi:unnamed protein product [Miscanthus lutarioriparius]|uniref:Uncharacterized protein n=1 Tax=Miscanthus lutarioriparius TaxID=422564 RepID=A0A811PSL9_9POAL|nr:unnamed protein product [Miscanthus lutarioriparius]